MWGHVAVLALRSYRRPSAAGEAIRALAEGLHRFTDGHSRRKLVHAGGRWYFSLDAPGWPSAAYDRYVRLELNRARPFRPGADLQTAVFAITRRCPLRCQHCSEWDTLNQPEALSVAEVVEIARRLEARGAVFLELSGGEPLLRLEAVEAVGRAVGERTDLWLLTSGWGLDAAVARRLRRAGVVGVRLSLDHFEARGHDAFRGVAGAFDRALAAAAAAREAGLVLCLTLTARRELATEENLGRYLALARSLGAGFVQILEPRAVGRWAGRDVALGPEHQGLLDAFHRRVTYQDLDGPIVSYPAHDQRRDGCWGAGDRWLFVDSGGRLHACPFCRADAGSALGPDLDGALARLRRRGCHAYPDASAVLGGRPAKVAPPVASSPPRPAPPSEGKPCL